jgi:hypothetical protein
MSLFSSPSSNGWNIPLSPSMGAKNQVVIWLSYRPASLCSLATQFQTRSWNRFLAPYRDLSFRLSLEENPEFIPSFFILHPVKGFLYREPECLSNRLNWVPPPLSPQASVAPPQGSSGGEPNSHAGRGWGDPIHTTGQTLWYSMNAEQ